MDFQKILEFCKTHWELLTEICISLIILIVSLCKRTKLKVVDSVLGQVLAKLPELISEAEKTGLSGHDKYLMVFSAAVRFLALLTNKKQEEVIKDYSLALDHAIESILATPQKKG